MQVTLGAEPFHLVYAGTQGQNRGSIVNFDVTNSILVGPEQGALFAINPECFIVGPLNSVTVDGNRDYWAIALEGTNVPCEFMPGVTNWSPSPAQAAIQISTLGLATEDTLSQVNGHAIGIAVNTQNTVSTLGSPAQDGSVQAVHTALGSPAQDATVQSVHTVLGAPAQDGSVQAVHTALGSPAQDGSVNGLLTGIPNNIAGTGAPLLALATQWGSMSAVTFTPGQSRQIGPGNFGQISFEGLFTLISGAADTNPSITVSFQWSDTLGNIVAIENWYPCGGTGSGSTYQASGRAKGSRLTVVMTNNGTANATVSAIIYQTSRVYVKDDIRSRGFSPVPNVPSGGYDPPANMILETAPTIAASAQVQRAICLYCGTVRVEAFTQTGGAQFSIVTQNPNGLTNNTIWNGQISGANGQLNQQIDLPRYQCVLTILNNGSSSQQIGVTVFISEQNI